VYVATVLGLRERVLQNRVVAQVEVKVPVKIALGDRSPGHRAAAGDTRPAPACMNASIVGQVAVEVAVCITRTDLALVE